MDECSFTCPLTCEGPGDPDHESAADRAKRLSEDRSVVDLVERAERGWLYDAEFHAIVHRAVAVMEQSGITMRGYERGTAIRAAAVAVVLAREATDA